MISVSACPPMSICSLRFPIPTAIPWCCWARIWEDKTPITIPEMDEASSDNLAAALAAA
jgi:hypothetical protein